MSQIRRNYSTWVAPKCTPKTEDSVDRLLCNVSTTTHTGLFNPSPAALTLDLPAKINWLSKNKRASESKWRHHKHGNPRDGD